MSSTNAFKRVGLSHAQRENQARMDYTAKKAASLLWDFYRDPLRSLTLLSLNVLSQKS